MMVRERILPIEVAAENMDSPFIGITVCPYYTSAFKKEALYGYGLDKRDYTGGVYFPKKGTNKNDARATFVSVTQEVGEILKQVDIWTRYGNDSHFVVNFEASNQSDHIDIETKYWPLFGRCYSLSPRKHVLQQGLSFLEFYSRIDIYIYLTYPGQFMHTNSRTKVIKINS